MPAHQLDAREVRGVEVDRLHVRAAVLLVELLEAPQVARLLRERAHDADARERLLQVAGDRGDLLARGAVGVGGDDPEEQRREPEDREHRVGDQRELGVEREQDRGRADQRQRGAEQRHDAVADQRVERLDVVGEPRDQHAGALAREEADAHALQVLEELDPQVLQRALADPADEVGLRVGRAPVGERGDQERDDDPRPARSCRRARCPCRSRARPAAAAPARPRWRSPARRTSAPRGPCRARSSTISPRSLRPRPEVARQRRIEVVARVLTAPPPSPPGPG